jgi:hypothetical protein
MIDYNTLKIHLELLEEGKLRHIQVVTPSELASIYLIRAYLKKLNLGVKLSKIADRKWNIYSIVREALNCQETIKTFDSQPEAPIVARATEVPSFEYYIIPTILECQEVFNGLMRDETEGLDNAAKMLLGKILFDGIRQSRYLSITEFHVLKAQCSVSSRDNVLPKEVIEAIPHNPSDAKRYLQSLKIPVKDRIKLFSAVTGCSRSIYYKLVVE